MRKSIFLCAFIPSLVRTALFLLFPGIILGGFAQELSGEPMEPGMSPPTAPGQATLGGEPAFFSGTLRLLPEVLPDAELAAAGLDLRSIIHELRDEIDRNLLLAQGVQPDQIAKSQDAKEPSGDRSFMPEDLPKEIIQTGAVDLRQIATDLRKTKLTIDELIPAALRPTNDLLPESLSPFASLPASKLLALLPLLSEKEQEEAANRISNLSDEKVTARWAAELVSNRLPPAATKVLFASLHNQPQELFLPTMASIADQPTHPCHQEAVDALDELIGPLPENTTWSALVETHLKSQNPPLPSDSSTPATNRTPSTPPASPLQILGEAPRQP